MVLLLGSGIAAGGAGLGLVDVPEVGVVNSTTTNYTTETVDIKTRFYIDNPNPLGTEAPKIDYRLYWNEQRDGDYEYLGEDQLTNVSVPARTNKTHVTNTTIENNEAGELATTLEQQGYAYVRVESEVQTFDRITVNFARVIRIDG